MIDLIEVEFVGGPLNGPGFVHPAANAMHLNVEGFPQGYYCAANYLVTEDGPFRSRYYWMIERPVNPVKSLARRPWWKRILILIATLSPMVGLNADEPRSLIDSIEATAEAREILIKDLQEADLSNVRSQYAGCPTTEQFTKILADEKRYNAAAKRWLKEVGNQ